MDWILDFRRLTLSIKRVSLPQSISKKQLFLKPTEEAVDYGLAVLFINGSGEWDIHRTGLHAVLCIAAVGDPVFLQQRFEAFVPRHLASGMHVEEPNLRDRLRSNVVITVILRTGLETAAARHTTGVCVPLLHLVLIHSWSGPEIVGPIQFDPGVNTLQMIKHLRAVNN